MTGARLFLEAISQVFRNFEAAMRIGLVFALILTAVEVYIWGAKNTLTAEETQNIEAVFSLADWLLLLLWMTFFPLIAVAWHRFALLGEPPISILPRFSFRLGVGYLGRTVGIMFVSVVPALMIFVILGDFTDTSNPDDIFDAAVVIAWFVCGTIMLLFGVLLPAYATERRTKGLFKKARSNLGVIIVISLFSTIAYVGYTAALETVGVENLILFTVITGGYHLFGVLIGVSQLTVLYEFLLDAPVNSENTL